MILLLATLAIAGAWLRYFLHVPTLPLPAGVVRSSHALQLAGERVTMDIYHPAGRTRDPPPLVVIAHGFSRNRKTMAGWGGWLAREGFIAVVPDLPFWADHPGNARALVECVTRLQSGQAGRSVPHTGPVGLVGFSAGGGATLLAAAAQTNIACWVGLAPVGMGPGIMAAAQRLGRPAFVLRAEPAPWNAWGNAESIFAGVPGPAFSVVVREASHVDAENPTSRAAAWACGHDAPHRRAVFGRYLVASLHVGLNGDKTALAQLWAATNDAAVKEVRFRRPEAF